MLESLPPPPAPLETFARDVESIVLAWKSDDPQLDWVLRATYSVARVPVIREQVADADSTTAVHDIEATVRTIEKTSDASRT